MNLHHPIFSNKLFLLNIGLFLSLSLVSYHAISSWHKDWQLIHQAPKNNVHSDQNNTHFQALIDALPRANFFGEPLNNLRDVPFSDLQIAVTGIVKSVTGDAGSKVYISIAGKTSKIYEVGDAIEEGVTVYSIAADTVVFARDGHLEKINLPRSNLQFHTIDETNS